MGRERRCEGEEREEVGVGRWGGVGRWERKGGGMRRGERGRGLVGEGEGRWERRGRGWGGGREEVDRGRAFVVWSAFTKPAV
jgi:hypothetical protein